MTCGTPSGPWRWFAGYRARRQEIRIGRLFVQVLDRLGADRDLVEQSLRDLAQARKTPGVVASRRTSFYLLELPVFRKRNGDGGGQAA